MHIYGLVQLISLKLYIKHKLHPTLRLVGHHHHPPHPSSHSSPSLVVYVSHSVFHSHPTAVIFFSEIFSSRAIYQADLQKF